MGLSEKEMYQELPAFITDPANQAKVEALLAGRKQAAIDQDSSLKLEASL
jgi:hypothetical protein